MTKNQLAAMWQAKLRPKRPAYVRILETLFPLVMVGLIAVASYLAAVGLSTVFTFITK